MNIFMEWYDRKSNLNYEKKKDQRVSFTTLIWTIHDMIYNHNPIIPLSILTQQHGKKKKTCFFVRGNVAALTRTVRRMIANPYG